MLTSIVTMGKALLTTPLRHLLAVAFVLLTASAGHAQIRIVAVGDSSFRGGPAMHDPQDAFPARLEHALQAKGYNVTVTNAGINGEMAWQTRDRLKIAVPDGTKIALVAAGANDIVYQHAPRSQAIRRLKDIIGDLRARGIEVLVFNLGRSGETVTSEQIAAESAAFRALGAIPLPPMQAGLVDRADLHVETSWKPQTTLWHLNREGNDIVAGRILPQIEQVIARLQ